MKRSLFPLLAFTVLASLASAVSADTPASDAPLPTDPGRAPESKAQLDARMAWWHDAKFGMFIHWGVYALPAKGEWYANDCTDAEYAGYVKAFNPVDFDAAQWVQIVKNAGMKYIVITSKHHDGFCMWGTKAGDYNIVQATPYGKDPLKALSEECQKQGIHFCTYFSVMDWHHPSQFTMTPGHHNPVGMKPGRKAEYVAYMKQELTELITQYHSEMIWFDGSGPSWWTKADGIDLYDFLLKLDPKIIINNRVGGDRGDFGSDEQFIPDTPSGGYWESCMTINDSWGYNKTDFKWKSAATLIQNVVDCASKGGNYLLNVGPTELGVIPQPEVERLAAIGDWLKINGEAIYGSNQTILGPELGYYDHTRHDQWNRPVFVVASNWRCTAKPGKVYIEFLKWTGGKFDIPNFPANTPVVSAYFLCDPNHTPVTFTRTGSTLSIDLPATAPAPIVPVLCLEGPKTPATASNP